MTNKLTAKQRTALEMIHRLTTENGVAPTIRQLRLALDVSSDQTAIDMLERLEKKGLIERDRKQARGIVITDAGKKELGLDAVTASVQGGGRHSSALEDQQQKVFDYLSGADERLGKMYKGALHALNSSENEDAIPQSAFSMREVIDHLSGKGEIPPETQKKLKASRDTGRVVQGLLHFYDPQLADGLKVNPYTYLYDKYQNKLNSIAHHRERIEEATYRKMLSELEYFLLRYIFPSQVEIYKTIDDVIAAGIAGVGPTDLRMLITRNVEAYRYFFRNATAAWFPFLQSKGFLEAKWEVGEYLARIAPEVPDDVGGALLEAKVAPDDWTPKAAYVVAASKLPAKLAALFAKRVVAEDWTANARAHLLHYRLQDLLKTLMQGKEYEAALSLHDLLLDVKPSQYGTRSYRSMEVTSGTGEYEYSQIVSSIAELSPSDSAPFIALLASKLKKALAIHADGKGGEDYSSIWRTTIEKHSMNRSHDRVEDSLIDGVRDSLEKRVEYLLSENRGDEAEKEIESLLSSEPQYTALTRLRMHIYRLSASAFPARVAEIVSEFDPEDRGWHEYALLVQKVFPSLDAKTKEKYFSFIDTPREDDGYTDSWKIRLIAMIRSHLSKDEVKKYKDLLKTSEGLEHPDLTSYAITNWVGPQSPMEEADFSKKSIEEIIESFKDWTPTDEFMGPSRSGLGRTFSLAVGKEGERFSREAEKFLDPKLRPVYIYNFINGLQESLKVGAKLDWKAVVNMMLTIVERAQGGVLFPLGDGEKDRLEADWSGVFQEGGRLIIRGLDTGGIDIKDKKKVWSIISFLVEHPDPTPEREEKYNGDNGSDPYTTAINTVRGEAMQAVFAYIFWHNRSGKATNVDWEGEIPENAKKVLEAHLNPAHDPSLAVRSIYGMYLSWLLHYGKDWAYALLPTILPLDNNDLRYAAWETYLANAVNEGTYQSMRPYYERALDDVRSAAAPKRKFWADPLQRLAEHAVIAYAYELDTATNPFYELFFAEANGKMRGLAVSFAGRTFVSRESFPREEKVPETPVLMKFWDWRLADSNAPSELKEFGWWTKRGKFEDKWLLEHLLDTLKKTRGEIDGEFLVLKTIDELAPTYPRLAAEILKLIFTSNNRRDRYVFMYTAEIQGALLSALRSTDKEAQQFAHDTIDYLLKMGFEDFRSLPEQAKKPKEEEEQG